MARVMNPGGPHLDAPPCPARSAAKPAGWRAFSGHRQATHAPVCARAPCTRPTAHALLRVANFRCPLVVPKPASNEHPTPPRSHAGPPETRRRGSRIPHRAARALPSSPSVRLLRFDLPSTNARSSSHDGRCARQHARTRTRVRSLERCCAFASRAAPSRSSLAPRRADSRGSRSHGSPRAGDCVVDYVSSSGK